MYFINRKILVISLIGMMLTCCLKDNKNPASFDPDIRECFANGSLNNVLEMITWNVHEFPADDDATLGKFSSMVAASGADILALQEMGDGEKFSFLLAALPQYDGYINAVSEQNTAFLVKKESSFRFIDIRTPFEIDPYAFPRPPIIMSMADQENDTIFLINVHLKCCEGPDNEQRRKAGLEKLKLYIDTRLGNSRVIILGDFNEELTGESGRKVFKEFLADSLRFRFADIELATGPPSDWSYPGWPSHIDHFLLSDEWFGYDYDVTCLKPDLCDSSYFATISDHRPVRLGIYLE